MTPFKRSQARYVSEGWLQDPEHDGRSWDARKPSGGLNLNPSIGEPRREIEPCTSAPFEDFYQAKLPNQQPQGMGTMLHRLSFEFSRGNSMELWIDQIVLYRRLPESSED